MKPNCTFIIPRGNTCRYIYIFEFKNTYYKVTKKVLFATYRTISVVNIPVNNVYIYINTVVALTY